MGVEPPIGFTWAELVEHHLAAHGSWTALADELARRVRLAGGDAPDLDAATKGLRRLAKRGQASGGQYGGWMIRCFGVPTDAEAKLRWLAQYHSRFSDLPTSVRRDQLRLWDRPPISESAAIAWVHVGLASVFHRRRELEPMRERLAAALRSAANPLARMESGLLDARAVSDAGDLAGSAARLDEVEAHLDHDDEEHVPYRARLAGQRSYLLTRVSDDPARFATARALFEAVPDDSEIPFVNYRRTAGLAYCAWRLGDADEGARLAREAAEHAADGGLVRFRVMALNMLARMTKGEEARALRRRAGRLARSIEDLHLEAVSAIDDG